VAWIRRVRTASGATAVQIAEYDDGRRKIVAHVGSAHTEAELGILIERAREMLADPAQGTFDLGIEPAVPRARLVAPTAAPTLFDAEPRDCGPGHGAGDRALGFWSALRDVFPETTEGPHWPGHPQRDPPAPPAALGDHRRQRCCPDVPARHRP
jgi:hypothetical protein